LLATTKLGAFPSGVDISSKAIEVCRSQMPGGVFHAGQAEMLPFDDKQFDIVSCLGALEHFREPSLALREMVRVAKEDALFLLLVPNADFLTRRLGLYGGTEQVDVKEDVRTLSEWQILFETSGIQIIDRWRDLHVLSRGWIFQGNWYQQSFRLMQAIALTVWPLKWQYQVYFLGKKKLTA
jgi:SAM-dependent methyltransferase